MVDNRDIHPDAAFYLIAGSKQAVVLYLDGRSI
jgi:hypothetical protein